ncbi:unnamed protein product [Strongylus vulgaris]|uniref:Myosin tail domain-containing protein n=1 Tax=Strongylus vulgaris TaxID=40348 RepID=A0A3P7L3D0_STRVU|nr:unnamed protein product [Strongylus vulgaris]
MVPRPGRSQEKNATTSWITHYPTQCSLVVHSAYLGMVKPLLKAGKEHEEMEKLSEKIKSLEEAVAKGDENRKQLESQVLKGLRLQALLKVAGLVEEKNQLFLNLEKEKANLQDAEERNQKLAALKADLDKQLAEVQYEQEIAEHKKHAQDLELSLKKAESEKQVSRDALNRR